MHSFKSSSAVMHSSIIIFFVFIFPNFIEPAGIQQTYNPNLYQESPVVLYHGNNAKTFLSLCTPGHFCPLDVLTRPDLKAQQLKNLRLGQAKVRLLQETHRYTARNIVKIACFVVCLLLSIYLVFGAKHIDYKLFGREWIFDGTYGFHAKILRRMKFELMPQTIAEYERLQKKKQEAVQKLQEACRETGIDIYSDESGTGAVTVSSKRKIANMRAGILQSSKKQRILRKKYQQKFEDSKQKYIMDERKKYRDEESIVVSEIRRIENETKTNGYHRKLLTRFKVEPDDKGGVAKPATNTSTFNKAMDFSKITRSTAPTRGLLDIRMEETTGELRDLDQDLRGRVNVSLLKSAILAKAKLDQSVRSHHNIHTKAKKQVFNKVTQRYEDVEDDEDED